ncbi:MAG: 23S rRNA (uracil(1939)-C(5))-methyltransferase RlmD [Pseudomonadota bacterium]
MPPAFAEGDLLTVTIERLAYGGDGVAHPDGFTLFVPRTAPGDRVEVRVTDVRRRYGRAVPQKILEPSPHRVEPPCKYYSRCGGCHYQHMRTEFWREQKEAHIRDAFERLGPGALPLLPIIKPEADFGYRNRLTLHRSGQGAQGYVAWNRHEIVDVEDCPIAQEPLNELWKDLRVRLSDVDSELVPFVVLRRTTRGQCAVVLSATGEPNAAAEKILLPRLKDLPSDISLFLTPIKTGARSPFGDSFIHLAGAKELVETVKGIDFYLRPDLFFQVHPEITERMVEEVLAWGETFAAQAVLDVFSGAGLFALHLARTGKSVLGVEVHYPAVLAAQKSADANGLATRALFRGGKAETILEKLVRKGERFEAAVVDPPRKGIPPKALENLLKIGIRSLLYISCSPPTMARDLKCLAASGFETVQVQPYDMFPQTYHVETIARLRRSD